MLSQNVLLTLLQFGIDLLAVLIVNHQLHNDLMLRNVVLMLHSRLALILSVFVMTEKNQFEMQLTFVAQLANELNVDVCLMVLPNVYELHQLAPQELDLLMS
jgi:predicted MFS family arabinose efflux permease